MRVHHSRQSPRQESAAPCLFGRASAVLGVGQRQQPRQRTWGSQTLATAVTALRVRRSRRRAISAGASLALRLRVLVTRGRLDRQIAVGRTCAPAATLALRARQLSDPRTRQRTAENLRGVVAYVDRLGSRP